MGDPAETDGVTAVYDSTHRIRKHVKNWAAIKSENVVMQASDYSCGAAALATLFRYYWQIDIAEDDVLDVIIERLSDEEFDDRQENGLSMTDLRRAAVDLGFLASIRRSTMSDLADLKLPVIVRIVKDDYEHFVVLRGIVEDRVFLADPIYGNSRLSIPEFQRQWNEVVLVVIDPEFGGLPDDSPLAVRAIPPIRNELWGPRRSIYRQRVR